MMAPKETKPKIRRTSTHSNHSRFKEKELLSQLQEMLPEMQGEKKPTKLKVIRGVIEYIKCLANVIDNNNNNNSNDNTTNEQEYKINL